jgi:hypothetical protein
MRTLTALRLALRLVERPATVRQFSNSQLPEGVGLLLAIAAGKANALRDAQTSTGQSEEALRTAASFFIEQIMLGPQADSYRVLGAKPAAARSELRRHMVLLMQWLHPDHSRQTTSATDIDRTIFIHRITQAWGDLKNDERRAAYDQVLKEQAKKAAPRTARPVRKPVKTRWPKWRIFRRCAVPTSNRVGVKPEAGQINTHPPKTRSRRNRFPRLVMFRVASDTLLTRLLLYLRERQ